MNRNELLKIVRQHFGAAAANIRDYDFAEMPLVKAFRKEVKNLRAFFALLEMETHDTIHFTLSKQIQKLYINMGIVAKLHFHLENIKRLGQNTSSVFPVLYIKKIQQNIDYWNDCTKELLRAQNNFDNDEKLIISFLPDQLRSESIKKFLEYSSFELQRLQNSHNDESLQSIKKLLEDISYNWQFVRRHSNLLPKHFSQLKHINEWIKILADLHKNSIDIALLHVNDPDMDGEREILNDIEKKLIAQNDSLRQNIYSKLNRETFDALLNKVLKS